MTKHQDPPPIALGKPTRPPMDPRRDAALNRIRAIFTPSAEKYRYTALPWREFKWTLLVQAGFKCAKCGGRIDPDKDQFHPNFDDQKADAAGWLDGEEKLPEFYRVFCHSCHLENSSKHGVCDRQATRVMERNGL